MNYNIGVNVVKGQSASPIAGVTTAESGIIGVFEKGALNKDVIVTDMASFEREFGSNPVLGTVVYYAVKSFFEKVGQAILHVVRVADSNAASSTVTLQDQQGAPADTLKVDAKNEGTWGNNISVDVDDHSLLSTLLASDILASAVEATLVSIDGLEVGSYLHLNEAAFDDYVEITQIDASNKIVHWSGGITNPYTAVGATVVSKEFTLKVYWKGNLVETWTGLTMNDIPSFFCEKIINGNSDYIVVDDLKAVDTDYEDNPAATASPQALTSGNDGLSTIATSDYQGVEGSKTGVYAFDAAEGLFRFAVPDPLLASPTEPDIITIIQSMLSYCDRDGQLTTFYADIPNSKTVQQAVTFADNFSGQNISMWFPYGLIRVDGKNIEVPPSASVIANAVVKDFEIGVYASVGNTIVPYFTDLKYHISVSEGGILETGNVNPLRRFTGRGIRTYGGRTQSAETAWRFINWAEYFNFLGRTLSINLQDVPFQPNNEALWKSILRRVGVFMDNQIRIGAVIDYAAQMDNSNNPTDQVALGIAILDLEYQPVGVAEKFVIRLTNSPAGISVTSQ